MCKPTVITYDAADCPEFGNSPNLAQLESWALSNPKFVCCEGSRIVGVDGQEIAQIVDGAWVRPSANQFARRLALRQCGDACSGASCGCATQCDVMNGETLTLWWPSTTLPDEVQIVANRLTTSPTPLESWPSKSDHGSGVVFGADFNAEENCIESEPFELDSGFWQISAIEHRGNTRRCVGRRCIRVIDKTIS